MKMKRFVSLTLKTGAMLRKFPQFSSVCDSAPEVHLFPMFSDNYGFILVDKISGFAACVDAGDGEVINKAVLDNNFSLKALFCTHKHSDHVGGNSLVKNLFPSIDIIGPKYVVIPSISKPVSDGDTFQFGSLNVEVLHVSCHTKGHIAYFITSPESTQSCDKIHSLAADSYPQTEQKMSRPAPLLFCGDTLFVGGCGRFFEGTATDMLHNMDRFSRLSPETIVYCAHEYTESNLRFLSHIDPENCNVRYTEVKRLCGLNIPTVPTTIGEELKYNLFMKCHEKRTQKWLVGAKNAVEAMHLLREMKNNFK